MLPSHDYCLSLPQTRNIIRSSTHNQGHIITKTKSQQYQLNITQTNNDAGNMSSSISEKSVSHQHAGMPQSPTQSHFQTIDFLPEYEQNVNNNLRNFGDAEAQSDKPRDFDGLQEPARPGRESRTRRYLIIASLVSLALICTVVASVLASRTTKEQVPIPAQQTAVIAETLMKTSLQHRSTFGSEGGVVFVTDTVTELETAGSVPSTTSSAASAPRTTLTDSVTAYITISQSPSYSSTTFSFDPATTSTTAASSTTTSTSINQAAESSFQALLSSLSAALTPKPIPTASTFLTKASPTTVTSATSLPAPAPSPASTAAKPASTDDSDGGGIYFCSVPGSSCNEKREGGEHEDGGIEFGGET